MTQPLAGVLPGGRAGLERVVDRKADICGLLGSGDRCRCAMDRKRARLDFLPCEMIDGKGNQLFDARQVMPQSLEDARVHFRILIQIRAAEKRRFYAAASGGRRESRAESRGPVSSRIPQREK